MKSKTITLTIFCVLTVLFGLGAKKVPPKPPGFLFLVTVSGKSHQIWSVSPKGKARLYQKLPQGLMRESVQGSTVPLLSPKGDKLAYLVANNLFIKNLASGKSWKITQEGFAKDSLYAPVHPLISGWSFDGTKLVYFLRHMEPGEEGAEEDRPLKVMPLTYGYYLYDLSLSESKALPMEDYAFCGWNAQDEMLFQTMNSSVITVVDLGAHTREVSVKAPGAAVEQVAAGPSGTQALALLGEVGKWSKVVKVDMANGNFEEISTPFGWGDCNGPSFSPSGARTAWIQTVRGEAGTSQFLVVDKNVVLKLQRVSRYRWVDDGKIVLVNAKPSGKLELLVVRADDGKVLDRHSL